MGGIPQIETDRLRLRAPAMQDWPAYQALMGSARARYMGGPFDTTAAWGMFCHETALWGLTGIGALMVDRRSDGRCVGLVGINQGPLFYEPELGWFLYDGYEGQGYAQEAAIALRDWAFASTDLTTLVSYIDPDNLASQALARRMGAVVDPDARRTAPEDLVFRHTAPSSSKVI